MFSALVEEKLSSVERGHDMKTDMEYTALLSVKAIFFAHLDKGVNYLSL